MAKPQSPFNISLLQLTPQKLKYLPRVTNMSIRDPSSGNFHDEGFYSYTFFGPLGSPERDQRFAYIDCKVPIFHPVIYDRLIRIKRLYGDIISSKAYAQWDPEAKDFVSSSALVGQTGYAFFCQHVEEIQYKRTKSPVRDLRISVVESNMYKALTSQLLVLPAGLREIDVKEGGFESEQEITQLYRKFLAISNTVPEGLKYYNDSVYDSQRWSLQRTFNDIYHLLMEMFQGKKGFFQGKWGSRRVYNGTRNVISALNPTVRVLGSPNQPSCTDVQMGLYQSSKAMLPIAQHALRTGFLAEVFGKDILSVELTDPETLERESVELDPDTVDDFTTWDGIERLLNTLNNRDVRNEPVMVAGRYLGLLYVNDEEFRFCRAKSDVPEQLLQKPGADIHPITYTELVYLSGFHLWNKQCAMVTRYPVSGMASVVPCGIYIRTTVNAVPRRQLDYDWSPIPGNEAIAWEYPDWSINASFVDTSIVSPIFLRGLGADEL